ncbi:hypothetical protein [Nonomuraea rhizosphaerae]|uniref:hypothetical protein n=1 Tax=Nonomuraea rhizosphaerae TaxID=2665663 RepID=UPI001C5D6C5D|nr:hypothetical protein [Nonomuraea rhizosphaerae]
MTQLRFVKGVVVLVALFFLIGGVWAFGWPQSFYDLVAHYPPFNLHLFHDAGAFQLGIAAALIGGLFWQDALFVGLLAGAVGTVVHAVSHIIDKNLGGNPSDPWTLSLLALVVVSALIVRVRSRSVTQQTNAHGIEITEGGAARREGKDVSP